MRHYKIKSMHLFSFLFSEKINVQHFGLVYISAGCICVMTQRGGLCVCTVRMVLRHTYMLLHN